MADSARQGIVHDLLAHLKGLEPLKQLFWSELNYERVDQPLSLRGWPDAEKRRLRASSAKTLRPFWRTTGRGMRRVGRRRSTTSSSTSTVSRRMSGS